MLQVGVRVVKVVQTCRLAVPFYRDWHRHFGKSSWLCLEMAEAILVGIACCVVLYSMKEEKKTGAGHCSPSVMNLLVANVDTVMTAAHTTCLYRVSCVEALLQCYVYTLAVCGHTCHRVGISSHCTKWMGLRAWSCMQHVQWFEQRTAGVVPLYGHRCNWTFLGTAIIGSIQVAALNVCQALWFLGTSYLVVRWCIFCTRLRGWLQCGWLMHQTICAGWQKGLSKQLLAVFFYNLLQQLNIAVGVDDSKNEI